MVIDANTGDLDAKVAHLCELYLDNIQEVMEKLPVKDDHGRRHALRKIIGVADMEGAF